jgi:hypothetical protein
MKTEMKETAYKRLEETARTANSATEAVIQRQGAEAAALGVLARTVGDAEAQVLNLYAQTQNFQAFAGPNPQPTEIQINWPTDFTSFTAEKPALEQDEE